MNQWAPALSSMLQQSVSLVAQHSLVELGLTKEAAALLKPAGDLLVTKCIDKVKERRTQADMVSELEAWVDTENISESDFAAGMATAKEVMQLPVDASGLSFAERLDSEQIAELYKEAAREKYPDWDKDQGFSTVASRAIDTVCSTIAKGLLGQETTYRAAILQIAAEVGTLLENLRQLAEQGQPPDLDSPAVNLAVRTYLRVRLRDWDETPSWLKGHSASVLERNLRAIEKDTRMEREETRILTEDEALEGVKALVVRGGPGAGKTWLSKRYARKAAQEALDRLEADVSLREVEIPLWTTFATWARCEPGPVKQRLAEASFDARLNLTTINATATDLVLRLFKECDLKVLAIVDSFDEATVNYRENYAGSLLRLAPDWRVVITSREGAWRENRREDLFDDLRTVDLQPLEWPVDMQAFVRRWFEPDAAQAEALLAQVEQRPDLRQMVTVPLLLAFICLIGQSEGDLPASRRDIYDRVVRRLLVEPWRQRDISQQNIEGCMKQLLKWAAQVAGQVDPVSGLGRWQDTIVTKPVKKDLRAVDNVAPVAFTDDEGNQTRRFIHRTVLEHLVAEWVASLSLKKAEAVLLPHLWFDSDWAYVTPAAIAAHPRRNVLLRSLLNKGQSRLNYPAHQGANFELGSLAVVLTQVSQPSDWPEKEQKYIAHTWFKCILRNPNKGVRAALPWANALSDRSDALVKVTDLISRHTGRRKVEHLADLLGQLARTDLQLGDQVVDAIRQKLPQAKPGELPGLVVGLVQLVEVDPGMRDQVVDAYKRVLRHAGSRVLPGLVVGLVQLGGVSELRDQVVDAYKRVLPQGEPWMLPGLVNGLVRLNAVNVELGKQAITVLVEATQSPNNFAAIAPALRPLLSIEDWIDWLHGEFPKEQLAPGA